MSKTENHKRELTALFDAYFETGDAEPLLRYIVSNSNLPGRRANLECAQAFGDLVETYAARDSMKVWGLCVRMADTSPREAPVDAPLEFIPFCGTVGIGAVGSVSSEKAHAALVSLRELAGDPRWRMREAVRFGLQRLLAHRRPPTSEALRTWIQPGAWMEMRAAATALADPALLEDRETARTALRLHEAIMAQVLAAEDRRSEPFRVLRKALGYTLSVVTCAIPEEGFALLAKLVDTEDRDALWIVRQNLKKKRLTRAFAGEVASIQDQLLA